MINNKKLQQGYTLIELLVMAILLTIILAVVSTILINVLRQRTRANLNSQVRATANEVMTILIKNIKDSRHIVFADTIPTTTEPQTCWYYTPSSGNECPGSSVPYCEFSQMRLDIDDTLDRVYFIDQEQSRILFKDINKDTNQEVTYPVSPSSLKVNQLVFTMYPRLCYQYVDNQLVFANYEYPTDNITVKVTIGVQSPLVSREKAQAYTKSLIILESSASLRAYQRFHIP